MAILHFDGDSFFVACELARRPDLVGLPVVTGKERGIASAMSYEAKLLGVTRGYPIYKLKRDFPQVIVVPGDYEMYDLYNARMNAIVRRFSTVVEEYSIDECFAELNDERRLNLCKDEGLTFVEGRAREIQATLTRELGITFSVGVAPTKVLAKVASKWHKPAPAGFAVITQENRACYLEKLPVQKVWGIGRQIALRLAVLGVHTAGEFVSKNEAWVNQYFGINVLELWRELRGESVWGVATGDTSKHLSIQKTHTFAPVTNQREYVWAQLVRNLEAACRRARRLHKTASDLSFFLKRQDFRYRTGSVHLVSPSSVPADFVPAVRQEFERLFKKSEQYRTTGVTLANLQSKSIFQTDLFGAHELQSNSSIVFNAADKIEDRYGRGSIVLASSMKARLRLATSARQARSELYKHLSLPYLGEVC